MINTETMASAFRLKFEKFILGCESIQEVDQWDEIRLGEMDAFYSNEMTTLVLKLVISDNGVSSRETEFINKLFGFHYTPEELASLCQLCHDDISYYINEELENGLALLLGINREIADAYKDLLLSLCEIIISCDGYIAGAELAEAERLREMLKN